MSEYDLVLCGAGHNGLALAAYMAKAGLNVCVLEKNDWIGGAVVTQEMGSPGFKFDPAGTGHVTIMANPLILNDELQLFSKYGLEYIRPELLWTVINEDDQGITFWKDIDKTCAEIAKFSSRDADAYRKFWQWCDAGLDVMTPGMYAPPPPMGAFISNFDQSPEGREVIRCMLSSNIDLLEDFFESERLKIAMARFITEMMVGPKEKGTGLYLYFMIAYSHRYGYGMPVGGSGMLTQKLGECIKDHGGTIRTGCPVKNIKVIGGEAKVVVLEDGEEVTAKKAIVSSLNAKQLFLNVLGADLLPPNFQESIRRIKMNSFQAINQFITLNEHPIFKADVNPSHMVEFCPGTMEECHRHFDEYGYGLIRTDGALMMTQTMVDPTRAPEGKHTLYLYHYNPYHIQQGSEKWDEIKEQVADEILEYCRAHTTNMGPENIISRKIFSPLDYERWNNALVEGEIMHLGSYFFQSFSFRPIPGWGYYRTPIEKLYMTGSSTHPGGSVSCGSGRATAMVLCEDLDIDFEKLIE
jgi:phytoene dehydrogenase-like protein